MAVDRLSQVAVHDKLQVTRADVERALAKLEDGTYGACDVVRRAHRRGSSRGAPLGGPVRGRRGSAVAAPTRLRVVAEPTEYQVTYWRDLPSLVVAREGEHVTKSPLAARFQEAIDEAAMRLGDTGSDDYLAGWTPRRLDAADGSTTEVADHVVAELEEAVAARAAPGVPRLARPGRTGS